MSVEAAFAFFVAMLVFAATPGPGILAAVAQALATGVAPALWLSAGLVLGDLLYLLFAVFGLSAVAGLLGELFIIVKLIGGGYLIWLGWQLWRAPAGGLGAGDAALARATDGRRAFATGFLVTISNPKVVIFYLGFLPTFIDLAGLGAGDVLTLAALLVVALWAVLLVYVLGAHRARRLLRDPRAGQRMNRTAGAMLIGAGALLASRQ